MQTFTIAATLTISCALTLLCWLRIVRSDDYRFLKVAFFVTTAVPFIGPVFYLFANTPPRHIRRARAAKGAATSERPSHVLRRWNEREHIFLTWAGVVFVSLAVLSWWINDWSPGRIQFGLFGVYTDVDAIFFSLLVLATLAFGAALRARIWIERELREAMSNRSLESRHPTGAI